MGESSNSRETSLSSRFKGGALEVMNLLFLFLIVNYSLSTANCELGRNIMCKPAEEIYNAGLCGGFRV